MKEVVIVSAVRTPIGSFMGSLSKIPAPKLGAIAIKGAIKKIDLDTNLIDEVLMGHVVQSDVGQAPARQAAIFAGIPDTVPCTTVNKIVYFFFLSSLPPSPLSRSAMPSNSFLVHTSCKVVKNRLATSTEAVMYPGYCSGKFPARKMPIPSFHTVTAVNTQRQGRHSHTRLTPPTFAALLSVSQCGGERRKHVSGRGVKATEYIH